MKTFTSLDHKALAAILHNGGVVVMPSDTIYGMMARAADQQAVERVYQLRGRAPEKTCIILVASRDQIVDNSLWTQAHHHLADQHWPGGLSLVAPVTGNTPHYLHRGTMTLAYRVPDYPELRALLELTGPLIAPSANLETQPPAMTIDEARAYFGNNVDAYVDVGRLENTSPSTVVMLQNGQPVVLRAGVVKI